MSNPVTRAGRVALWPALALIGAIALDPVETFVDPANTDDTAREPMASAPRRPRPGR
jgi:hypothetical protein